MILALFLAELHLVLVDGGAHFVDLLDVLVELVGTGVGGHHLALGQLTFDAGLLVVGGALVLVEFLLGVGDGLLEGLQGLDGALFGAVEGQVQPDFVPTALPYKYTVMFWAFSS